MNEALSILIALGVPGGVFLICAGLRSWERLRLLEVARALAAADRPLSPEVIQALPGSQGSANTQRDLRRGVMLTAVGGGFFLLGALAFLGCLGGGTDMGVSLAIGAAVAAVGALPLCIGAALIFLSRTDR